MRCGHLVALLVLLSGCFSAPMHQGPVGPHFDGRRFINEQPTHRPGFMEVLKYGLSERRGYWQDWTENQVFEPPPRRVVQDGLHITFINHATTLVQMQGLNILTDPIWSERCSPVSFAGPKRVRDPGIALKDLPPIDVVIISHNHYDHLDLETLRALKALNPELRIFVGLGNERLLAAEGIDGVVALDWHQEVPLGPELTLIGWPAQHFSGRGLSDADGTLWLSYVLKSPAGPVYFAGDTGLGPHFKAAGDRFGRFRLAILPIGAYRPRWFMAPIHVDPTEAVQAALQLRAQVSVGMHFGTFPLAAEGQFTPISDLRRALEASRPRPRFWVLQFGQGRAVPPLL